MGFCKALSAGAPARTLCRPAAGAEGTPHPPVEGSPWRRGGGGPRPRAGHVRRSCGHCGGRMSRAPGSLPPGLKMLLIKMGAWHRASGAASSLATGRLSDPQEGAGLQGQPGSRRKGTKLNSPRRPVRAAGFPWGRQGEGQLTCWAPRMQVGFGVPGGREGAGQGPGLPTTPALRPADPAPPGRGMGVRDRPRVPCIPWGPPSHPHFPDGSTEAQRQRPVPGEPVSPARPEPLPTWHQAAPPRPELEAPGCG